MELYCHSAMGAPSGGIGDKPPGDRREGSTTSRPGHPKAERHTGGLSHVIHQPSQKTEPPMCAWVWEGIPGSAVRGLGTPHSWLPSGPDHGWERGSSAWQNVQGEGSPWSSKKPPKCWPGGWGLLAGATETQGATGNRLGSAYGRRGWVHSRTAPRGVGMAVMMSLDPPPPPLFRKPWGAASSALLSGATS